MTIQITSVVPRDMMTEDEVTRAAVYVAALSRLRAIRDYNTTIEIKSKVADLQLTKQETEAITSLLIERYSSGLAALGVKLKETPQ